jgi:hypothetical protein
MTERHIRFYTDEHIHRAAVDQLHRRGVEIIHSADLDMLNQDDDDHLTYATTNGYILVTCDDDFERLDAKWKAQGKTHRGIVYFSMAKGLCKDIGKIVEELWFLHQAADYENDLYNQIWRVKT